MSKYHATSQESDGGLTRARPRKRGTIAAATTRKPVKKTYRGSLPVSGQDPPRKDRRERDRDAERGIA